MHQYMMFLFFQVRNFLLIQEKFYKRRITFWVDGKKLDTSGFKPYKEEILRTLTPADTSMNPYIGVYATFEIDPGLKNVDTLKLFLSELNR